MLKSSVCTSSLPRQNIEWVLVTARNRRHQRYEHVEKGETIEQTAALLSVRRLTHELFMTTFALKDVEAVLDGVGHAMLQLFGNLRPFVAQPSVGTQKRSVFLRRERSFVELVTQGVRPTRAQLRGHSAAFELLRQLCPLRWSVPKHKLAEQLIFLLGPSLSLLTLPACAQASVLSRPGRFQPGLRRDRAAQRHLHGIEQILNLDPVCLTLGHRTSKRVSFRSP
mmetsp:Transcript_2935/g.8069  ORF Transcript_2935/g.8069 Transcript_2935/m.8069 type:complete len:224 (+) Transcript_2935:247-918(+)